MTNTPLKTAPASAAAPLVELLSRESGESLIDQIVRSVAARIDDRVLRGGARMPSIRQFAAGHGVSCFTVVGGYDKLVARGYLESRRGGGFYVRERPSTLSSLRGGHAALRPEGFESKAIDVVWLIRNM